MPDRESRRPPRNRPAAKSPREMNRPQRRILAATLLVCALIVAVYAAATVLAGSGFRFDSFVLYCLAPFLAVYFIGLVLWKKAAR